MNSKVIVPVGTAIAYIRQNRNFRWYPRAPRAPAAGPTEKVMRRLSIIVLACLLMASLPAGAVTIGASQDLGAVPANPGTGLLGNYYKFNSSSNIGSLSNANILI